MVDANNIEDGYYYAENGSTNTNGYFGFLLSAKSDQSAFQILIEIFSGTPYQRAKKSDGSWTGWRQLKLFPNILTIRVLDSRYINPGRVKVELNSCTSSPSCLEY